MKSLLTITILYLLLSMSQAWSLPTCYGHDETKYKQCENYFYSIFQENDILWTIEINQRSSGELRADVDFFSNIMFLDEKSSFIDQYGVDWAEHASLYTCRQAVYLLNKKFTGPNEFCDASNLGTILHFFCEPAELRNNNNEESYFETTCRGAYWNIKARTKGDQHYPSYDYMRPRVKFQLSGNLSKVIFKQKTSWKNINNIEFNLSHGSMAENIQLLANLKKERLQEEMAAKLRARKEAKRQKEERQELKRQQKEAKLKRQQKEAKLKEEQKRQLKEETSRKIEEVNDNIRLALDILNFSMTGDKKSRKAATATSSQECIFNINQSGVFFGESGTLYVNNIIPDTVKFYSKQVFIFENWYEIYLVKFSGDKHVWDNKNSGQIRLIDRDLDRIQKAWGLLFSKACKGASAGEF